MKAVFLLALWMGLVSPLKGVCLSGGYDYLSQVAELRISLAVGWDLDVQKARALASAGIRYCPHILLSEVYTLDTPGLEERIVEFARTFRGSRWLICNEPEWQHLISPERAVVELGRVMTLILSIDPAAQFVVGNVMFLPGGRAWLTSFVEHWRAMHDGAYPPVLAYGLHLYANWYPWDGGQGWLDTLAESEAFIAGLHPGAQIWYTEWGTGGEAREYSLERLAELSTFWFEVRRHPYFFYATDADNQWSPGWHGSLFENGKLTAFGKFYATLPPRVYRSYCPEYIWRRGIHE